MALHENNYVLVSRTHKYAFAGRAKIYKFKQAI